MISCRRDGSVALGVCHPAQVGMTRSEMPLPSLYSYRPRCVFRDDADPKKDSGSARRRDAGRYQLHPFTSRRLIVRD